MDERELIAERVIWAVDKDSRGFDVALMIGKPYQDNDTPYGDWACPVAMSGLHGRLADMYGIDSWQALANARQLIYRILTYFVEDGGKLFWEKNGNELSVAELFSEAVEIPEPLPPRTDLEQKRIDQLSAEEIKSIDDELIANASTRFRKVARVVGEAMRRQCNSIPNVPDIFYASRVKKLVEEGRLIAAGNLDYMRLSEVKLPD